MGTCYSEILLDVEMLRHNIGFATDRGVDVSVMRCV